MALKFLAFCALLAISESIVPPPPLPPPHHVVAVPVPIPVPAPIPVHVDYPHIPANYKFGYTVHDDHTGDIKEQHEVRHGDHVRGRYSLIEPDGYRRIVEYSADPITGFKAHVSRESSVHAVPPPPPHHHHIVPHAHPHPVAPYHPHPYPHPHPPHPVGPISPPFHP